MIKAQPDFPYTNEGKIKFIKTLSLDSVDNLKARESVVSWISEWSYPEKQSNEPEIDGHQISGRYGFYLFTETAFLKSVDGVVRAQVNVQLSDTTVTLAIDRISFQNYERDRYGKFSPNTSRKYELEALLKRKKGDTWDRHFKTIYTNISDTMDSFNSMIPVSNDTLSRNLR